MKIKITESTKIDEPSLEQEHPVGEGIQKIWRFKNGYGASVVRFKIGEIYGSYTSNEKEWELAVIKFNKKGDWDITYKTEITDDVIGHLTDDEVEKLLRRIKSLQEAKMKKSKKNKTKKALKEAVIERIEQLPDNLKLCIG